MKSSMGLVVVAMLAASIPAWALQDQAPPADVQDLQVAASGPHWVNLTWSTPADAGGGFPYHHLVKMSGTPINSDTDFDNAETVAELYVFDAPGTVQSALVTGLDPLLPYHFSVRVADGSDNWNSVSNGALRPETPDVVAPATITSLTYFDGERGANAITIRWYTPAGDDGEIGAPAEFDVCYSTAPITAENYWATPGHVSVLPMGSPFRHRVEGLQQGTSYYFAIRARDAANNWGGVSNVINVSTIDGIAPGSILNLRVKAVEFSYVTLEWTATGDDGAQGTATSYLMKHSTVDPSTLQPWQDWWSLAWWIDPPKPSPAGTLEEYRAVIGMRQGEKIWIGMRAVDDANNQGPVSALVSTLTVPDTFPPERILSLQGSPLVEIPWISTSTGEFTLRLYAKLTWTAPGDDNGPDFMSVVDYQMRTSSEDPAGFPSVQDWWDDEDTQLIDWFNFDPSNPNARHDPLPRGRQESLKYGLASPGITYYAIRSVDRFGNWSAISNTVSVEMKEDSSPPSRIDDLRATRIRSNYVDLVWTAASDLPDLGLPVSQYELRYSLDDPNQAPSWLIWQKQASVVMIPGRVLAGSQEHFTLTGLQPTTKYFFAIRAIDGFANSGAFAQRLEILTKPVDPAPPAEILDLGVAFRQSTYVTLTWTAPGDDAAVGTATRYEVRWSGLDPGSVNFWWDAALDVDDDAGVTAIVPVPALAGSRESIQIRGLSPDTFYWVSIRAIDDEDKAGPAASPFMVQTEPQDLLPPGAVTTLRAAPESDGVITVSWVAEGEDGAGSERAVDRVFLRYSLQNPEGMDPETWWNHATPFTGADLAPGLPGEPCVVAIDHLLANRSYYFSVRTVDEAPNWSDLSNIATASTFPDGSVGDRKICGGSARGSACLGLILPLGLILVLRRRDRVAALALALPAIAAAPASAQDWTSDTERYATGRGAWVSARAGDVNGDGYDDIVMGVPFPDGHPGHVDIYFGGANGLSTSGPDVTLTGQDPSFGTTVARAGDVDSDGYADIIVGSPQAAGTFGLVHVFPGGPNGPTITRSWTASGNGGYFGESVGTAGDVDGDGADEVIVGAWNAGRSGMAYVYSLKDGRLTKVWEGDGGDYIKLDPEAEYAFRFGFCVSTAGDVNGDGFADVIIGAPGGGPAFSDDDPSFQSRVYVFHGSATGLSKTCAWFQRRYQRFSSQPHLGMAAATAGDIDNDGFDDVIVSSPGAGDDHLPGRTPGEVQIFKGGPDGLQATAAWTVQGPDLSYYGIGTSLGSAGDFNGDGFRDIIVGNTNYMSYVYFGSAGGLPSRPDLVIDRQGVFSGGAWWPQTEYAGDINGDWADDLLVAATGMDADTGAVLGSQTEIFYGSGAGMLDGHNDLNQLAQSLNGGGRAILRGETLIASGVRFSAVVRTSGGGTLEVEVRETDQPFQDSPTESSTAVAKGAVALIDLSLPQEHGYHWQARARSAAGTPTRWRQFGPAGDRDFSLRGNEAPVGLRAAQRSGGVQVGVGQEALENSGVELAVDASDAHSDNVVLQVELRPLGEAFVGAATHSSSLLAPGGTIAIALELPKGSYHWQWCLEDSFGAGRGSWMPFGGNSETQADFVVVSGGSAGHGCASSSAGGLGLIALAAILLTVAARSRQIGPAAALLVMTLPAAAQVEPITDLVASMPSNGTVELSWTVPPDVAPNFWFVVVVPGAYEVRMSTQGDITADNWYSAALLPSAPNPYRFDAPMVGEKETMKVSGLSAADPAVVYTFSVRALSSWTDWWSAPSNSAQASFDFTAPAAVGNLQAADVRPGVVELTWSASGDDGMSGRASAYDLRRLPDLSRSIVEADWIAAERVFGLPAPGSSGAAQAFEAPVPDEGGLFHFALRVVDERDNWSPWSNAVAAMVPPAPPSNHDGRKAACAAAGIGGILLPAFLALAAAAARRLR